MVSDWGRVVGGPGLILIQVRTTLVSFISIWFSNIEVKDPLENLL